MLAKNLLQRSERRSRAFFLDQNGRQDRTRGIIQRDDQIERRQTLKPVMARSILMQQYTKNRPPRQLTSVGAPPGGFGQ
jgi:hypothetical protein